MTPSDAAALDAAADDAATPGDASGPDATSADAEVGTDAGDATPDDAVPDAAMAADVGPEPPPGPAVILVLGSGMGPDHVAAARVATFGAEGSFAFEAWPGHALLRTASFSGTTDAAAAATTLMTGRKTLNGRAGVDRDGLPIGNLFERARGVGMRTGLVTTGELTDPTPAGLTVHTEAPEARVVVANDLARVGPEVVLGGGARWFLPAGPDSERADEGLLAPLLGAGYTVVRTAAALTAAEPDADGRLIGLFAQRDLGFRAARGGAGEAPDLPDLTEAALRFLAPHRGGFLLVIDAGHLGRAATAHDAPGVVAEIQALSDTVARISRWARGREDVTVIVAGDVEIGDLRVLDGGDVGAPPAMTFGRDGPTNRRVPAWATGPGADALDGSEVDQARVFDVLRAAIDRAPVRPASVPRVPDGHLGDLRWQAAVQVNASGFDPRLNRLDTLLLDVDPHALSIGVVGRFESGHNAVVVLIDVDPGAGTGPAALRGSVTDGVGAADALLARSPLGAPAVDGFGADLAVVIAGGVSPRLEELRADGGLRGLHDRFGRLDDLAWRPVASAVHELARTSAFDVPVGAPLTGLELQVPLAELYPERADALTPVPPGAAIAVAVVLVNDDGGFLSNQALPPFPAETVENPGAAETALPGVARFILDPNGDGRPDGDEAPEVLPR